MPGQKFGDTLRVTIHDAAHHASQSGHWIEGILLHRFDQDIGNGN